MNGLSKSTEVVAPIAQSGQMSANGISLLDLAKINEEIKAVVELSRSIGLGAINAGLISNKCNAGNGSRGFGVATSELRQFSGKLENLMHKMEAAVFREIGEAATLQRLLSRRNALAMAEEKSEQCGVLTAKVVNMDVQIARGRASQMAWRRSLLSMLKNAEQISKGGFVTARVARLEAVGGGSLATTMTMAVSGVEDRVAGALEIIRKLTLEMERRT